MKKLHLTRNPKSERGRGLSIHSVEQRESWKDPRRW